jgi:hypothetical protein
MALATSVQPSHARRRVVLVAIVLLLAAGTVVVVAHFHYPKTFHVALKLDPRCSSAGVVHVDRHNWTGSGTTAKWPPVVRGAFKIVSPRVAVFTADEGGTETFTLLPKGRFWTLDCPLG